MGLKTSLGEEGLLVENERISVKIGNRLNIKPALQVDGVFRSLVSSEAQVKPAFHIKLGGLRVTDFVVDWKTLEIVKLSDALGRGQGVTFTALADQYGDSLYPGLRIECRASLSFYERFPEVVIGSAQFTNLGKQTLVIDEVVGNYYCLDRRLVDPGAPAWRFASYQGAAYRWGCDYSLIWIESDTDRRNFMGTGSLSGSGGEGGGTPLVDLWTPECGLAVAGAETSPQWISLPVRTNRDSLVELCGGNPGSRVRPARRPRTRRVLLHHPFGADPAPGRLPRCRPNLRRPSSRPGSRHPHRFAARGLCFILENLGLRTGFHS